ncbi:MAG: type II secretion system protein M [Nevskia sp.]|nr:type II secretion system protein M [Nevskia sp.]
MNAVLRQKLAGFRAQIAGQTAPYRARYEALQPREQTLVSIAAVMVIVALLYSAIWQPIVHHRQQLASELQSARAVAGSLAQAEFDVRSASPLSAPLVGSDVSLLTAVDQAAKNGTLKKPPARLQPDGDNQARIWFEDVEFDVLLRWMNELQTRYGVRIEVADIERQPTPGLVNARLAVVRAP